MKVHTIWHYELPQVNRPFDLIELPVGARVVRVGFHPQTGTYRMWCLIPHTAGQEPYQLPTELRKFGVCWTDNEIVQQGDLIYHGCITEHGVQLGYNEALLYHVLEAR